MSEFEAFEVDEDFDPFAVESLDDLEEEEPDNEYSVPVIPDADKSIIPEHVELPAEERIRNLLKGMPAQHFRVLAAVKACAGKEKTLDEIIEEVDAEFSNVNSVFSTGRIVQLLERAGAIERIDPEDDEEEIEEPEEQTEEVLEDNEVNGEFEEGEEYASPYSDDIYPIVDPGVEYVEVQRAKPSRFIATEAGIQAYEASIDIKNVQEFLSKEPQYLPIYKRILTMCNVEGGRLVQEINAVIDPDPICAEPRRFATYFLRNLEDEGAVRFDDTWKITDYGKKALDLGLLAESEQANNDKDAEEAASAAKEKQLAKEAKFEAEKAERDAYYAELEAKKQEEIQRAIEAGEPLPEEEPKNGSGGPRFAFPYTPPQDEIEEETDSEAITEDGTEAEGNEELVQDANNAQENEEEIDIQGKDETEQGA